QLTSPSFLVPHSVLFLTLLLFLSLVFLSYRLPRVLHSFPTRRSSDLLMQDIGAQPLLVDAAVLIFGEQSGDHDHEQRERGGHVRSEEHTSELQSRENLVCRLLLEKKKTGVIHPSTAWTRCNNGTSAER